MIDRPGCTGTVGDKPPPTTGAAGTMSTGVGGSGNTTVTGSGNTGASGVTTTGTGGTTGTVAACPTTAITPTPLRRLTRFEYANTVRNLLNVDATPANDLPADLPAGVTPTDLAAYTVVARVLLNLDETITKQ